jgi:CubicO group peptidase (beta-lactamase class C family)
MYAATKGLATPLNAIMLTFLIHFAVLTAKLDLASIERTLEAELAETRTPGAVLVVVRGEEVLLSKGYGVANVETREPVTPDHLFRLGSTTKLFTAVAVATLAEQGKLDLHLPVGNVVQGLPSFVSSVTAHQLLSHTAGLKDQPADFGLHDESALAAFPRAWGEDYRLAPPGVAYSYSNPGFALAGLLVEEATGKAYADAMKEILFAPLGMERATFRPTEAMTRPLSQGHEVPEEGPIEVVRPFSDDSRQWPNGFLMTTASEMGRFVLAFLNGGRLEGREVLSPAAITRVSKPSSEIPYDLPDMKHPRYGYGLFLHTEGGVAIAEHVGSMPGFTSILEMAPEERFGVVLLANREGVMFDKTLSAALSSFLQAEAPAAPEPKPIPMTESERQALVGVYKNRWPIAIVHEDGALPAIGDAEGNEAGALFWRSRRPSAIPFESFRADGRGEFCRCILVFKKEGTIHDSTVPRGIGRPRARGAPARPSSDLAPPERAHGIRRAFESGDVPEDGLVQNPRSSQQVHIPDRGAEAPGRHLLFGGKPRPGSRSRGKDPWNPGGGSDGRERDPFQDRRHPWIRRRGRSARHDLGRGEREGQGAGCEGRTHLHPPLR